jgi:hypothetical protein
MKPVSIHAIIFFLLNLSPGYIVSGQESRIWNDEITDDRIKTVQLFKEGWNLSLPVVRLNSDDKLD